MKTVLILFVHALVTIAKLMRPGGAKSLIAKNLVVRHQLIIANRSRKRAPNLTTWDRFLLGLWTILIKPIRLTRIAIVVSPATLFRFHNALKKRKYHRLFSAKRKGKPGPRGPSQAVIEAIVEMKRRNARFGCPRIAQQISRAFGIEIDKDIVRRVLAKHYRPIRGHGGDGPSWLTVIGHMKDSLWSVDFFRCESIQLKTHWVMVVMDQYTRRIIGFGVQRGDLSGSAVCWMFNQVIAGLDLPKYLSSDNDPLFLYHRWQANLRILEVNEIKTVPYVPISHPFVERLIGSIRREYLDHVLFWNVIDLESKLNDFKTYYNEERVHTSLESHTPAEYPGCLASPVADLDHYRWNKCCGGLVQLPVAA